MAQESKLYINSDIKNLASGIDKALKSADEAGIRIIDTNLKIVKTIADFDAAYLQAGRSASTAFSAMGLGASTLMRMLGPVGAVITAYDIASFVKDIYSANEAAKQAKKPLLDMEKLVVNLTEHYNSLSEAQKESMSYSAKNSYEASINSANQEYKNLLLILKQRMGPEKYVDLKTNLDSARESGGDLSGVIKPFKGTFPEDFYEPVIHQIALIDNLDKKIFEAKQNLDLLNKIEVGNKTGIAQNDLRSNLNVKIKGNTNTQIFRNEVSELDHLTRALEAQIDVLGMSSSEIQKYRINMSAGSPEQKQQAILLLETAEAYKKQTEAAKEYDDLMLQLRTKEEKKIDAFNEKMKALDSFNLSPDKYAAGMKKVSSEFATEAPSFNFSTGSAYSGDLLKVAEANYELDKWKEDELEKERAFLATKADYQVEYNERVNAITAEYNQNQASLQGAWQMATLSTFSDVTMDAANMLKNLGQEGGIAYKTLFLASKAAGIAQAIINTEVAATKAIADLGVFGMPMAATVRALGYTSIGIMAATALTGMAHNGLDSVPKEGTWLLDKGERVLSPQQNQDLTSYLANVNGSGGSSQNGDINVQIVVNSATGETQTSGSSDRDTRLMAESLKAAVLQVLIEQKRPHGQLDRNNW